MDPQKAWQVMTAMLLTMETQQSANSNLLNSTVSAKQRNIVSGLKHFYNVSSFYLEVGRFCPNNLKAIFLKLLILFD